MAAARKKIAEIVRLARKDGRRELLEIESKQMLAAWDVRVNRTELARDSDEAVRAAREVHYPLVVKVVSPNIPVRSGARCVKVGVSSELELRQAFDEVIKNAREYNPKAKIIGVTVQEYLPPAREVSVGAMQDPSFGAVVRFGLAGLWTEVLNDFSFRLAPLSAEDARDLIREIKGYPVLEGVRGENPADLDAVVDIIQKVGRLVHEFPEIARLDIDSLFTFDAGKGAIAADARVVLRRGT